MNVKIDVTMKKYLFSLFFTLGFFSFAFPQKVLWKANVHSFFDNTEFTDSEVQTAQTMAGVHLAPEIGLSWQQNHRIFAGVDLLHEFGSDKAVDYYNPIVYYEYSKNPFRFYMGAIPRKIILNTYPRMFFSDSINNYRPTVNGFFWEIKKKNNYANIWLDWTGKQSEEKNEAFFMGWSGRYNHRIFYARHSGYMFHYARKENALPDEFVHDNGLLLTSAGLDFSSITGLEKLEIDAGWSIALDRNRGIGIWNKPQGFVSEAKVEYRGLGLFNTFYLGEKQQTYFNEYGNKLYWGDSFYRLKQYNRTDIYIQFIKREAIDVKFTASFHFAEEDVYFQQALYASFALDNLKKKKEKKYRYLWAGWF
ncbi:MAG: hypothetical protein LBH12_01525 [Dysgonamonadaceae bacterium]|jgi:hypothetical protein|nr:hypothetical protein [Dysgonamonadaceae bacterium]